jgi:hypothetical protein
MVSAEEGVNPDPDTVTEVPTGPVFGKRKIEAPFAVAGVSVIAGGCSTSCHKPVGLPLFV